MTVKKIDVRSAVLLPAAVGTDETKALFNMRKGERVLFAAAHPMTAAAVGSTSTVTLGDGDDPDGYIAAIDTETMVPGTPINGGGAYLANSGGKLYTVNDTIDAVYDQTTPGVTNPKIRFTIGVIQDQP